MVPSTQKAGRRPISFVLDDGTGTPTAISLFIRPEDLTATYPSRQAVTQTLGGAWLDDFGAGVSNISISGHTGWRGNHLGDGAALFQLLQDTVFTQWHALRDQAVQSGQSPDTVKLIFADTLDNIAVVVAPQSFILKRSRVRPLLMMYQIQLIVLGPLDDALAADAQSAIESELAAAHPHRAGYDSLANDGFVIGGALGNLGAFIQPNMLGPVGALLGVALNVITRAQAVIGTVEGAFSSTADQLITLAAATSLATRNALYTYGSLVNLTEFQMFYLMRVAAAFDDAFCVLNNVFAPALLYPDYSDVYGASNCSSTAGGSPLSPLRDQSALGLIIQPLVPDISVSPVAQDGLTAFASSDYLYTTMQLSDLAAAMSTVAGGVVFK